MSSTKSEKTIIRKRIRKQLSLLSYEERLNHSQKICQILSQFLKTDFSHQATIATYAPYKTEVDLTALISLFPHLRWVYPRCSSFGQMDFYEVKNPDQDLTEGYCGILEPRETCPLVSPEAINLILMPAFAYTLTGKRLGKGGGFYDRYILRTPSQTKLWGVAFRCQILDELPTDTWDKPVDKVFFD